MTKQEILQELESYRKAVRHLIAQAIVEAMPDDEQEWPQEGDEYWAVSIDGSTVQYKSHEDPFDLSARNQGNCYPSCEAAEKQVRKNACIAQLWRQPGAEGFKSDVVQWGIEYSHYDDYWIADSSSIFQTNFTLPYFHTEEQAEAAIANVDLSPLIE